jgi:hypothetical protein
MAFACLFVFARLLSSFFFLLSSFFFLRPHYRFAAAGIFSYASRSDGGEGIAHMWAVANALRLHGINTYCGLMVRTDGWQQKW